MSEELAKTIALKMIARADAKAIQRPDGEYMPHREDQQKPESLIPWSLEAVMNHLNASQTFGHYLLDHDSTAKLFVLDIDLNKEGTLPTKELVIPPDITEQDVLDWMNCFEPGNPREAWRDRAHPARKWIKSQFRDCGERLASICHKELGIEVAVAYSGNKGIHVYGFTGRLPAHDVREAANIALELMGLWSPVKGRASTYVNERYDIFSLEVYPKQDVISEGSFGNLVRLPLGKNLKSPADPTFFVDLGAPVNAFVPVDPLWALTEGARNPWSLR